MKLITTVLAVVSLFVIYSTPATAQDDDCWHYENGDAPIVGSVDTPGEAEDVAVAGNYAYVADDGSGLQIINIVDPANPQITGSVDTPGDANGVAVFGIFTYVADGDSGLQVIDVTNPENPWIAGSVDTPGFAFDVAVSGDYAYIADGESGLQVIDISVPESPALVGAVDTPSWANGVAVSGSYAYVAGMQLYLVNITDPENPQITGSANWVAALGVAVAGDYAYVAAAFVGDPPPGIRGFVHVIDITDPQSPQITGSAPNGYLDSGIAVSGSYAYVAGDNLLVVDITDPQNPQITGSADTPDDVIGVAVAGNYVYVADHSAGLQIAWRQCEGVVSIEVEPEVTDPDDEVPVSGQHFSVYPNPFNPNTTVSFSLDRAQHVTISVYDMIGSCVAEVTGQVYATGAHTVEWNGQDSSGRAVSSGTYLVRMETEDRVESQKIMLVR